MGTFEKGPFKKMKFIILTSFLALSFFAICESCLVINCSGVTAATCTSPCYQCGACKQNCCQSVFFGREDTGEEDRTFEIFCASGREDSDQTPDIEALEKKSFKVCDEDEDGGLSWDEVEMCEEQFGQFVNLDHLPDKNDFDHFDTDGNGILFLEEWEAAQ